MYTDQSLQSLKDLFADRLTTNPDVKQAILDPLADLPSEDLRHGASDLARWLLAVYKTTRTPAIAGNNAREKALHSEDGRLRMLLHKGRFNQNALNPLHDLLVEVVANADRFGGPQQLRLISDFLNTQTKRRVAAPTVDRQMPDAS